MAVFPTLAAAAAGLITITTVVFLIPLPCLCQSESSPSHHYETCAPSTCGNVKVEFPFTSSAPFCGLPGLQVACQSSIPTLELSGRTYQVKRIFRSDCLITVADEELVQDLGSGVCATVRNGSLPIAKFAPLELPSWWSNLTSFVCTSGHALPAAFDSAVYNFSSCVGRDLLYYYPNKSVRVNTTPAPCTEALLPVDWSSVLSADLTISGELVGVLAKGFPLQWPNQTECWKCEERSGRCGFNQTTASAVCFPCQDGCPDGGGG